MNKEYTMVRMPRSIFEKYKRKQERMNHDLYKLTNNPKVKLSMTKVFNIIVDPKLNENSIEIDLKKMIGLAKKKKGNYE